MTHFDTSDNPSGALVRAAVLHDALDYFERHAPGERAQLEESLPPEIRKTLRGASRIAWLPVETDVAVTERLLERLGRKALWDYAFDATHAALESPLLSGPARMLKTSIGPARAFRLMGMGWKLTYRRMGILAYRHSGSNSGTVVFEGLPKVVIESEAMRIAFEGIVAAVADRLDEEVHVAEGRVSVEERKLEIAVSW